VILSSVKQREVAALQKSCTLKNASTGQKLKLAQVKYLTECHEQFHQECISKLQGLELDLFEWKKWKFANMDFWIDPIADTVPRIDGLTVPKQEFIDKYEQPELPVVILNLTKEWPAEQNWSRDVSISKIEPRYDISHK
jgi:hypothetical protein